MLSLSDRMIREENPAPMLRTEDYKIMPGNYMKSQGWCVCDLYQGN